MDLRLTSTIALTLTKLNKPNNPANSKHNSLKVVYGNFNFMQW